MVEPVLFFFARNQAQKEKVFLYCEKKDCATVIQKMRKDFEGGRKTVFKGKFKRPIPLLLTVLQKNHEAQKK